MDFSISALTSSVVGILFSGSRNYFTSESDRPNCQNKQSYRLYILNMIGLGTHSRGKRPEQHPLTTLHLTLAKEKNEDRQTCDMSTYEKPCQTLVVDSGSLIKKVDLNRLADKLVTVEVRIW